MSENNLRWYIEWYNKTGDDIIVGKRLIPGLSIKQAREIVMMPETDEIVDGIALEEKHVAKVQEHIDFNLDFKRYHYFLGVAAIQ